MNFKKDAFYFELISRDSEPICYFLLHRHFLEIMEHYNGVTVSESIQLPLVPTKAGLLIENGNVYILLERNYTVKKYVRVNSTPSGIRACRRDIFGDGNKALEEYSRQEFFTQKFGTRNILFELKNI